MRSGVLRIISLNTLIVAGAAAFHYEFGPGTRLPPLLQKTTAGGGGGERARR